MNNIHGLGSGGGGQGRPSGGAPQGGGQQSFGDQMKSGWASIPLFCKFILTTCILIYLVSFVFPAIITWTILMPGYMLSLQFWRLITGPFVHENFMNLLFSVISYVPSAMQEENNMGTVAFAVRFFKLSLFIDFIFSLVSILLGLAGFTSLLMTPAMGLWPILMCDLVIQCYQYPEMPRGLCCLPVQIKSKWYPLVLIGLFTVFFGPQMSLWTGLGVGYLWAFGYIKFLETSLPSLKAWEERWPFKTYKQDASFRASSGAAVSGGQGSSGTSFMGGGNQSQTSTVGAPSRSSPPEEEKKSSFSAFKGKGVSLGSDLENTRSSSSFTSSSTKKTSATKTETPKDEEQKQARNLAGVSAIVKQREERERQAREAQEESMDLISLDEPEGSEAKKAGDGKGDYAPVTQNTNNQYQQ